MGGADVVEQIVHHGIESLAGSGDHLHEQQSHNGSVALRDVTLEGNTARLLAADQHVLAHHVIGNMIEPDRGFVQLQAIALCQAVDHARRGDGPHHGSRPAALLDQILQRQGEDLMRIDEVAALVHGADAVRVAVGHHAEVAHPRADGGGQRAEIPGDRLRVDAAEAGIHLAADLGHLAARSLQKGFDHAAARSVHGIHDKALRVFGDHIRIDQRAQMIEVRRQRVELLDQVGFACLLIIHEIGTARLLLVIGDVDLDAPALLGEGRTTERPLELDAVVARGIMGGGDHHARDRAIIFYRVRDGGGRRIRVGKQDGETVRGQDARHFHGITIGKKSGIEADHDPFRVGSRSAAVPAVASPVLGADCIRNGLGNDAQIVERKRV